MKLRNSRDQLAACLWRRRRIAASASHRGDVQVGRRKWPHRLWRHAARRRQGGANEFGPAARGSCRGSRPGDQGRRDPQAHAAAHRRRREGAEGSRRGESAAHAVPAGGWARVRSLRQDANVYRYNEKGDKVFLDTAARENAIAENNKMMREIGCTPRSSPDRASAGTFERGAQPPERCERPEGAKSRSERRDSTEQVRRGVSEETTKPSGRAAAPKAYFFSRLVWLIFTSAFAFRLAK